MAALSVTAASVLASAAATIVSNYLFGATITAGQAVYLDTATSTWKLLDIDAASGPGCGLSDTRGIALNGGSSGQPASVCIRDTAFTPGATMTNGKVIYAFTTAGAISEADIPATSSYPVVFGIAKSTTKLNLQPFASGAVI